MSGLSTKVDEELEDDYLHDPRYMEVTLFNLWVITGQGTHTGTILPSIVPGFRRCLITGLILLAAKH